MTDSLQELAEKVALDLAEGVRLAQAGGTGKVTIVVNRRMFDLVQLAVATQKLPAVVVVSEADESPKWPHFDGMKFHPPAAPALEPYWRQFDKRPRRR